MKHLFRRVTGSVTFCILWVAFLGAGCASPRESRGRSDPTRTAQYVSDEYRVRVRYPDTLRARHTFAGDYLLAPQWNPDEVEGTPGEALLSLALPASNELLDARLRLGASRAADAVGRCSLPDSTSAPRITALQKASISGVPFERVDTGDAAMNHFLHRRSYRAVRGGVCYAIDLVVSGVNPGVYSNPPAMPMTKATAFERLTALLAGVSFSD